MNLLSTSELIKKYQLDAKKSLGQNFILDKNFTDKIVKSAGEINNNFILEIGAGPGSLTRSILDYDIKQLFVIEKDERCINLLNEIKNFYPNKLTIISDDALKIDELKIFKENKFKIIANLPYNISTVLIFKWLKISSNISSMTLMVQKEVAERITAKIGNKNYGRLSILINYLCDTKINFIVSNSVFTPRPKVTSAIISIIPKNHKIDIIEFNKIEKLVAISFNQKRKTIKNSLKSIFEKPEEILKKVDIAENSRPQDISIDKFVEMSKYL